MDDIKIRYKFYLLYFVCVLFPLVITDTLIVFNMFEHERNMQTLEMQSVADSVINSLTYEIEEAAAFGANIYKNSYINDYITKEYEKPLDYVIGYQDFRDRTLLTSSTNLNGITYTIYADNPTIVNGGFFQKLSKAVNTDWYRQFTSSNENVFLYFDYTREQSFLLNNKRRFLLIRKMDYFRHDGIEKVLKVDVDYSSLYKKIQDMNLSLPVYVISNDVEILSNTDDASANMPYGRINVSEHEGYVKDFDLYGRKLKVFVQQKTMPFIEVIYNHMMLLIFLICMNIIFPLIFMTLLNNSFTKRIQLLTRVMQHSGASKLRRINSPKGKDEIGTLMNRYNEMALKIEDLIRTVYKNKIKEQEMILARQNAELLALRGQINPHFLFNTLEGIRMHSVIKKENETADMIQRLAILQRQYVEWGSDNITIGQELEGVTAYLELQKYRFGGRLNYRIEMEEECRNLLIPKLTIVTFTENSCIHGVENKSKCCWIFVRVTKNHGIMEIEVEDTGIGMSEEQRIELLDRMNKASLELLQQKGRVGIVNACLRLKINTNNNVSFSIESELNEGTVFTIKIPTE